MFKLLDTSKVLEYFGFDSLDELFIGVNNRKPIPSHIIDFLKIKRQVSIEETNMPSIDLFQKLGFQISGQQKILPFR